MHGPVIVFLSVAGLGTAILAAVYWFKSAVLRSNEFDEPVASISDAPEQHIQASVGYILSIHQMINESSRLNKWAATWTGVSALFGAIISIYGAL